MKNRILLVDDSITIHRVIDLSLETDRFEVEKAFTYEDAINKIKKFNPEVVLLDNKLEGVDINRFIEELKNVYGSKVILLVGAFDNFDESKIAQYGCDDFLVKPFSSQSLEDKLSKILPEYEGESIVVPLPEEKDVAVEELMSKISEDVDLEELKKDTIDTNFFEETDLKIELEEPSVEEQVLKSEELDLDLKSVESFDIDEKDEKKESVDDIFADLEEIDTSALLETQESLAADELLKVEDIEKEIESVKVDKVDLLEDLIEETEKEKPFDISEELPIVEEVSKPTTEDLGEKIEELEDLKLEETLDIKLPETIIEEKIEETVSVSPLESIKEELVEENSASKAVVESVPAEKTEKVSDIMDTKPAVSIDEDRLKGIVAEILNEDFIKSVIKDVLSRNLEKAVWELIPELAEKLILAEIEKIKSMGK